MSTRTCETASACSRRAKLTESATDTAAPVTASRPARLSSAAPYSSRVAVDAVRARAASSASSALGKMRQPTFHSAWSKRQRTVSSERRPNSEVRRDDRLKELGRALVLRGLALALDAVGKQLQDRRSHVDRGSIGGDSGKV